MTDAELLSGLDEMIKDAPGVGLCPLPFKVIRDAVVSLIAERDALKQKTRWISVEERLPEPETSVMVAFDDGDIWCLWQNWDSDDERDDPLIYFKDHIDGPTHTVTHWMLMPDLP
jgi:hypothetical protein